VTFSLRKVASRVDELVTEDFTGGRFAN
jgi:hypothetical protein